MDPKIIAFDVLMFFSILLLVLALVPPFMSRYVVRRKTWHTIMFSMLVFSIGEVLLVGHQEIQSPRPNQSLCVIQVGITHSTPPLVAIAMAAYTADIYLSIRSMFKSNDWEDGPEPENVVLLVIAPWIAFFLVFLEAILVVGLSHTTPAERSPAGFYCRTDSTAAVMVSVVVVIIGCLIAIICQGTTGWMLYKNWINVQRISIKSTVRKYIHAFVRTVAFTVVAVLGIIMGVVASAHMKTDFGYTILMPFLPILAGLIFGTYKDIMMFYVHWK